jgi:hypothetical protein
MPNACFSCHNLPRVGTASFETYSQVCQTFACQNYILKILILLFSAASLLLYHTSLLRPQRKTKKTDDCLLQLSLCFSVVVMAINET